MRALAVSAGVAAALVATVAFTSSIGISAAAPAAPASVNGASSQLQLSRPNAAQQAQGVANTGQTGQTAGVIGGYAANGVAIGQTLVAAHAYSSSGPILVTAPLAYRQSSATASSQANDQGDNQGDNQGDYQASQSSSASPATAATLPAPPAPTAKASIAPQTSSPAGGQQDNNGGNNSAYDNSGNGAAVASAPVVTAPAPPIAPTTTRAPAPTAAPAPSAPASTSLVANMQGEPCQSTQYFNGTPSQWQVPPSCYAGIYSVNPANYVARSGFGWCNWWVEVMNPSRPDLLWGAYPRGTTPRPGATVVFAGGVQGASAAGHYSRVVAIAPGGQWMLVSEMNFYWRDGGWQQVSYRYVQVGPGISFIY